MHRACFCNSLCSQYPTSLQPPTSIMLKHVSNWLTFSVQVASQDLGGYRYVRYHLPTGLDVLGFESGNNLCQDLHGVNASLATFDSVADWVSLLGRHNTSGPITTSPGNLTVPDPSTESGDSSRASELKATHIGLMYTNWGRKFIWADGKERPDLIESVDMHLCVTDFGNDRPKMVSGIYSLLPESVCCATAALMEPGSPYYNTDAEGTPFLSYSGANSSRFIVRFKPCALISAILLCKHPLPGVAQSQPSNPPTPPARPPLPPSADYTTRKFL